MTEVESMLKWLRDEGLLVGTDRKLLEEFRAHHRDVVMRETRDALEDAGCVSAVVVDRDVVGRIVLDDLKNQMLAKGTKPAPGKTLAKGTKPAPWESAAAVSCCGCHTGDGGFPPRGG